MKKTKTELVKALLEADKTLSTTEISSKLGVSTRLVRYVKEEIRKKRGGVTANILSLDIETSPMEVYVWGLYKQRIPTLNVIKDWSMLSWAAKWLHEDEVISERVSTDSAADREDATILLTLWQLLDKADVVIAHNAIRFDVRKINARFMLNGYIPPSSYQIIDTLKVSQRNFGFSSHKLNYLLDSLDMENKMSTSFSLWKKCVTGDDEALEYMQKYNKRDVIVLEKLYMELRPWIKSHANMGLYTESDKDTCATCGSTNLSWDYTYATPVNLYPSYRCMDCGAIGRSRFPITTKEKRKHLTASIAH